MQIDLSAYTKYLNAKKNCAIIFLGENKFDPNNFCGEKFKKVTKIDYVAHDENMVFENPQKKGVSYPKEEIESMKDIIEKMGYKNLKFWVPSSESGMIITSSSDEHLFFIAPLIKNY